MKKFQWSNARYIGSYTARQRYLISVVSSRRRTLGQATRR